MIATVLGQPYTDIPDDLYIPPDALQVMLESFTGPLDLLLYLIKKQNIDILNIPIAAITHQYVEYIELMRQFKLELAAEYLVMAAWLAEIKSRLLLPRPEINEEGEEIDPRAELIRRLQEYEQFKQIALELDEWPQVGRDILIAQAEIEKEFARPLPNVELSALLNAFQNILKRAELFKSHAIQREPLSLRERMSTVLTKIQHDQFVPFADLFVIEEGRAGVVISFMAILELLRQMLIEIVQTDLFAPMYIRARAE